jgi:hypothetical protein
MKLKVKDECEGLSPAQAPEKGAQTSRARKLHYRVIGKVLAFCECCSDELPSIGSTTCAAHRGHLPTITKSAMQK